MCELALILCSYLQDDGIDSELLLHSHMSLTTTSQEHHGDLDQLIQDLFKGLPKSHSVHHEFWMFSCSHKWVASQYVIAGKEEQKRTQEKER